MRPFAPVTDGAECLADDDDDNTFRETSPHVFRRLEFHGEYTSLLLRSVEEFFLSGGPSSSAAVRVVVVNDIKEEEGERQ